MIIDFRYHIASLVAIFIALGLGILIGSTLVGQEFMENIAEEQEILIGKLENDYLNLRQETNNLRLELKEKQSQLDLYQNFMLENREYFIKDKLQDKSFAIIELGESEYSREVAKILEEAGASITVNASLFRQNIPQIEDINLFIDEINSHATFEDSLDGIVFLSSMNNNHQELLLELENPVTFFLEKKLPVYVIETSKNNSSFIEKLKSIPGVSSIDNFDNVYGQMSLVLKLMSVEKINN